MINYKINMINVYYSPQNEIYIKLRLFYQL